MTTSGITTNQLTRNDILESAFGILAVLAQGQAPSSEDYSIGLKMLNTTVARFRTKGLPLWARTTYSWVPTVSSYTIGEGQTLDTPFPMHILQAYRVGSSGAHVPISVEADSDYNLYPASSVPSGPPLKLTYQPLINYGIIRLWPTTLTNNTETVTIVYVRPVEYFNATTDTLDMPEEWYDAVIWDVATKLAPRWGVPLEDRKQLKEEAKSYLEQAMDANFEDASLFLTPDRRPS